MKYSWKYSYQDMGMAGVAPGPHTKLRVVAEAAEKLCEVVKSGELGGYQDDFRNWLVEALKAWREIEK